MVLQAKKSEPQKMKRSKSSHPILVASSSQTQELQNALLRDNERNKPPKGIHNMSETEKMLTEAEESFEIGAYEDALMKFSRGAKIKPMEEAFVVGMKKSQSAIVNDLKGTGDALRDLKEEIGYYTKKFPKGPDTDRSYFTSNHRSMTLNKALEKAQQMSPRSDPHSETLRTAFNKMKEKKELVYNLTIHDGQGYKTITATAQDVKEYLKDKDYFKMKEQTAKDWKKLRREMNKKIAEKEAAERYEKEAKQFEEKTSVKHHCEEQIMLIGRYYQSGKMADVIRFSENFIKYLNKKVDKTLPRKWVYLATAFNYLARANAEQGSFEKARTFGEKLYKIAISSSNTELIAQSYILSGKIYVKFGKFEEAAFVWEKLIPLIQDNEKKSWLFHEIGRCYFELGKYDQSYKFGAESVLWAGKCPNSTWSCTSNVLLGQVEMKRRKYKEALEKFNEAKTFAEAADDEHTLTYIKSVEDALNKVLNRKSSE